MALRPSGPAPGGETRTSAKFCLFHETVGIHEVGADEGTPVLRSYLREVRVVRPYFDMSPDAPVEAFAAEAAQHPVFRIDAA
ncbi:MAG TPA: hypothetical protein VF379_07430 [Gaiellaceae bacterium]